MRLKFLLRFQFPVCLFSWTFFNYSILINVQASLPSKYIFDPPVFFLKYSSNYPIPCSAPMDFRLMLHFSPSQLKQTACVDAVAAWLHDLLTESLSLYANSVAFPEYSAAAIIEVLIVVISAFYGVILFCIRPFLNMLHIGVHQHFFVYCISESIQIGFLSPSSLLLLLLMIERNIRGKRTYQQSGCQWPYFFESVKSVYSQTFNPILFSVA